MQSSAVVYADPAVMTPLLKLMVSAAWHDCATIRSQSLRFWRKNPVDNVKTVMLVVPVGGAVPQS